MSEGDFLEVLRGLRRDDVDTETRLGLLEFAELIRQQLVTYIQAQTPPCCRHACVQPRPRSRSPAPASVLPLSLSLFLPPCLPSLSLFPLHAQSLSLSLSLSRVLAPVRSSLPSLCLPA
eukprot:3041310-Rhodomonas_salina.3